MNLQKYFSQQKILSRREAESCIRLGKVKVNGEVIKDLATQIDPQTDKIELIGNLEEKTTVIFNKPRGISSSKVEAEGKNIFDLLPQFKHLNAIGRLDKESEGLILLSNDGVLTNVITGQDHLIEKEYEVTVRENLSKSKMNALSKGIMLADGPTLPTKAELIDDHIFLIVLKEGRNHQIRRMADRVRLTVLNLKRVRIGSLELGSIPVGGFRQALKEEVQNLKMR